MSVDSSPTLPTEATRESPGVTEFPTRLSGDGSWLWTGSRWVRAPQVSADGAWWWTGAHWAPAPTLSSDGRWLWREDHWEPAALTSPDGRWLWTGWEWVPIPLPDSSRVWALVWALLALGISYLSSFAVVMSIIGIADLHGSGLHFTWIQYVEACAVFLVPTLVPAGLAIFLDRKRRTPVVVALALIAVATSALCAAGFCALVAAT